MGSNKTPIPIKNLFYMLCYAWNVLAITDEVKVGSDDFDDAYNLLASVFSYGIGKLIRSGFHRSYIEETEELSTLRGKIQVQDSINQRSILRKELVCTYDDYSTNDIFNQILKYTIDSILKHPDVDRGTKTELKKQSRFFAGIDSKEPTKENRQKLVFNRNNITYRLLINIAIMLYDNTIVNDEDGNNTFKDFYRQEHMEKVFELFLLNFYSIKLDKKHYKVHAPKIKWHIAENSEEMHSQFFDVDDNPGDRRTDIVIENKDLNLQLIFDAKYYKKTYVRSYWGDEEERIRTTHIEQVKSYLTDSDYHGDKIGALIYPQVNHDLSRGTLFPFEDYMVIAKTINLNDEWRNIELDLLDFLNRLEQDYIANH